MSSEAEIQIGSDFVGYRIDEQIGRGGMGIVFRAYDLRLKRTVALKLMAPGLAVDQRFRERFTREAELAMSLEHPNVVPIHDAGDIDGRLYIAMRYVEGIDLKVLLRAEGALDPARAIAICGQAAGALDAAHASGLVHRDVKPSNVLLDKDEHVYLADFGLTRRLAEDDPTVSERRSLGTPAYLAPEQIEGGPVDGRADVYSLCCLLYECLTGEIPFDRDSRLAVAWAHLEEEPPSATERRATLPETIDDVIRKAMAKEPDDRYPSCAALITAAEEALALRRPRGHRRRQLMLGAIGALAVVAAAALTGALAFRDDNAPAAAPTYARPNTVTRIDPATSRVSAVIDVGVSPAAVAAAGSSVWTYNQPDRSVSEIDARTNTLRLTTTPVSPRAQDVSEFAGPVLAARTGEAWVIGRGPSRRSLLTRIRSGGARREFPLDRSPRAVAVGFDAVWVVARGRLDNQVLRIDPETGAVTARTRFPVGAPIDSIMTAFGAVWVVSSTKGTLYRIDPRTAVITGKVALGARATRPLAIAGTVWVGLAYHGGVTAWIEPGSLFETTDPCCTPDAGGGAWGFGSLWWYDWPSGSVTRQDGAAAPIRTIRLMRASPIGDGPCLTSLALGAGAAWVTARASSNATCRR